MHSQPSASSPSCGTAVWSHHKLDWCLLATLSSGFYVARAKGFYKEAGLEVELLSPHTDDYKATPASKVADGAATFACVPSESIISHHTWPGAVSTLWPSLQPGFVGSAHMGTFMYV